jgi:hypothetical protein
VWKLFFGGLDEILIREVSFNRNNDSPSLPSRSNCCAEGLCAGVFTQPGSKPDSGGYPQFRPLSGVKRKSILGDWRSAPSHNWKFAGLYLDWNQGLRKLIQQRYVSLGW